MKILKYCVIYNMLNFITFLQTISDSDYGYNFFSFKILKYWHAFFPVNDCQACFQPGMFLSKNYCCKKKMGQQGCIQCMSRARKSHDGIQPYKIQDRKKCKKERGEKWGTGAQPGFFQGSGGGSHFFKQRVLTIFLLPEYFRLFV